MRETIIQKCNRLFLNIDFMVHICWIIFSMVFMGKEEMKERNILYMVNCWN